VFELHHKNLFEVIKETTYKGLDFPKIRTISKQILFALSLLSLKSIRVIHSDLKPENIMLTDPKKLSVRVIDFGTSIRGGNASFQYVQSRFYRSPEVALGLSISEAIDMWSLGCIMFEMLVGKPLFTPRSSQDVIQNIVEFAGNLAVFPKGM
jgi:serine/threonine protein kinase